MVQLETLEWIAQAPESVVHLHAPPSRADTQIVSEERTHPPAQTPATVIGRVWRVMGIR